MCETLKHLWFMKLLSQGLFVCVLLKKNKTKQKQKQKQKKISKVNLQLYNKILC